jgi:hypothetical protein
MLCCQALVHMSASGAWSATDAEFPVNGSPNQKLGFVLKYVAFASTESNWSSWNVRLQNTHLELMAREDRFLETTDPDGREAIIGCGATLMYLKLALKHFGCLGRVALFPDLGQPDLVARVHFGFCGERNTQERLLFETMARGRTSVSWAEEIRSSEMIRTLLSQASAAERGWLEFPQSETSRQQVMRKLPPRDSVWINVVPSSAADTTHPAHALGWLPRLLGFGADRNAPQSEPVASARQPLVPPMTLAVVKTKTDDKHGWLVAGETMARTVLHAQRLGLSGPLVNPIRPREAREALRVSIGHKGFAQVILSFGPLRAAETIFLPVTTTASTGSQTVSP